MICFLAVGCYNPQLGNPGFYCHPCDTPACPDGQVCANDNRCHPKGTFTIAATCGDGGTTHFDGSSNFDFSGGSPDFAHSNPPDFSQQQPTMTGCNGLILCLNMCQAGDSICIMDCQNNATPNGNALLQNLANCVVNACPSTLSTDPCFDPNSAQCSQCYSDAQMPGGACASEQQACASDLP